MAGLLVVVQALWTQLPLVVDWNRTLAATRRPAIPAMTPTTSSSALSPYHARSSFPSARVDEGGRAAAVTAAG